jgi:glycosyltransferase involved in cell wall biosynthesis
MASLRFLVTARTDPSARFRIDPYTAYFREAGHDPEVLELPADGRGRRRIYRSLRSVDCVVLLRRLLVPWESWILRRAATRLIYEYDDALVYRDSARGATPSRARELKFAMLAQTANAVVAGSDYLASLAGPYRGRTEVVPTILDPADYPIRAPHRGGAAGAPLTLGWIGTRSNFPYLEWVAEALMRAGKGRDVTLRVMAECPPSIPEGDGLRVEFAPWAADAESAFLRTLDVGLMPLFDDPWCRGKCGLKALQYMATGVPVVASDVGVARDVIGPGGFVVRSLEAWSAMLERLLADPALRTRMGLAGRDRVERRYSPAVWYGRLEAAYLGTEGIDPGSRDRIRA